MLEFIKRPEFTEIKRCEKVKSWRYAEINADKISRDVNEAAILRLSFLTFIVSCMQSFYIQARGGLLQNKLVNKFERGKSERM